MQLVDPNLQVGELDADQKQFVGTYQMQQIIYPNEYYSGEPAIEDFTVTVYGCLVDSPVAEVPDRPINYYTDFGARIYTPGISILYTEDCGITYTLGVDISDMPITFNPLNGGLTVNTNERGLDGVTFIVPVIGTTQATNNPSVTVTFRITIIDHCLAGSSIVTTSELVSPGPYSFFLLEQMSIPYTSASVSPLGCGVVSEELFCNVNSAVGGEFVLIDFPTFAINTISG